MSSTAPVTPYTRDLGGRDPIEAYRDSLTKFEALTHGWTPEEFERRYAPGKWSARRILIHLAQSEIAFGFRARMTLAVPGYTSQNFDQDVWMGIEATLSGPEAVQALLGLGAMNLAFFAALTPGQREVTLTHPEYGAISVDWILHQTAGHQIHHLKQLERLSPETARDLSPEPA